MSAIPADAALALIAPTEHEAARLAASLDLIHLPAWDAAPLSDKPPSPVAQAARLAAVAAIDRAEAPRVACSALAAAQALPPPEIAARGLDVAPGDGREALLAALPTLGHVEVDRVDAPGTFATYVRTIDLWLADRDAPVRLRLEGDAVASIEPCDAATLRTHGEALEALCVPLAASNPDPDGGAPDDAHGWSLRHARRTLGNAMGGARVLVLPDAVRRGRAIVADIDAEHAERSAGGEAVPPHGTWLSPDEWDVLVEGAETVEPEMGGAIAPMPPHGEFGEEPLAHDDLVVHLHHGLGVYRGVDTVEVDGHRGDCLRVEFADGVTEVPAHEADLVWRYGERAGEGAQLARAGDPRWVETVARLVGELREAAENVRAVRADRDAREAPRILWDRGALRTLEADWYVPTPDQARALSEVRSDMDGTADAATLDEDGVRPPMDRLLCGDTGFGKTEIILRAAAATVEAGYQAVVAAPTTILADQHGVTFADRLGPLGMTVRVLTGATPDAERAETLAMLTDGTPMVVIGTHLLAGDEVTPGRPGLLVMDEEQRFGAAIKSALRVKEPFAHVLATTATPIPRTTMAALVGLRTVSTLRTPPPGRRGVRTEVGAWDAGRLRRSLLAERGEGGRSFVVVPRIEDMEAVERGLAELVPDLRTECLHGRLDDAETAERLDAFRSGSIDVLVATTVVETGIDVPEANLMAVLDAGRFGVGQLHQLRGRVGRGERRGRALLFSTCAWLDCAGGADERLALLSRHDQLGAGFALAARDLAQRGSGDLFGDEQTGHTQELGLELYARLMRGALDGTLDDILAADRARLHVEGALIPADAVPQPDVRARLYGRLAKAQGPDEVDDLREEIGDRFGPPPEPAALLIAAARASARARSLGATRISAGPEAIALDLTDARAEHLTRLIRGSAIAWKGSRVVLRSAKPDPERLDALLDAIERADAASSCREAA